jgi:glycosyltransferase involved in cell wall biosynthesis
MIVELKKFHFVIIPRLPEIEAHLFTPTKIIECMANGVVPICSNVEGMNGIINHGQNGFLFHAGDESSFIHLIEKIENISWAEYKNIRTNAQNTIINNYTWEERHLELNNLYKYLKENYE